MSRNSRRPNRKQSGTQVKLNDGTTVTIGRIPKNVWTQHHGEADDGTLVESISSYQVPGSDSTLLSSRSGRIAATNAEFEIFAKDFLAGRGFSVKAPKP